MKPDNPRLICPLPELDFDVITLGHGSGGLLTNQLLDEVIFKIFKNQYLEQHHDGAIFNLNDKVACTTDSFVVNPIHFPGGNIGDLAINGTVNDLAMCGAYPRYITLGMILEEGLPIDELWEILVSIKAAADHAGVEIITGDTKVVEKGKADRIFINTTGIGILHKEAGIDVRNVVDGDAVIVSASLANHGMAILSKREGLAFESQITSDTRSVHQEVLGLLSSFGAYIHFMRDPTRGGVATVLNELSKSSGLGVSLDEAGFPVKKEVLSACELMGLDPLFVANEGVFIAVVKHSVASQCVDLLINDYNLKEATIIGHMTKEHPKKVVVNSLIGGRRVVNMLPGDQLPRIC